MKQLTCEMCGSTDLIKQDGVFVCQSCGIKYSVEEAKKMMVEGVVDVSGSTVKVDTTEKLQNLYTLARRAREDDNVDDAARYYNEIRTEDPNNWEAVFYSLYFAAMQTTIAKIESAAISINNGLDTVVKLIKTISPEQQKNAYMEVSNSVFLIGTLLDENANHHFDELDKYMNTFGSEAQEKYFAQRKAVMALLYKMAYYWLDEFDDKAATQMFLLKTQLHIAQEYPFFDNPKKIPEFKKFYDLYDTIKEQERMERFNAYWEEHKEEKVKLEKRLSEISDILTPLTTEKNSLNNKKTNLNNQKNNKVPTENELNILLQKIASLKTEYDALGFFSGKRKKVIQSELDSLNEQKFRLENMVKEQKRQIQQELMDEIYEIDKALSPILEKIGNLELEKKQIQDELKKDR